MATFDPTIQIGWATEFQPDAGKREQLAEDGTITILNMYGQTVYTGKIALPTATATEKATVEAFYATNANLVWTFVHPGDGHTYSLYFLNEPKFTALESADGRFAGEIECIGTRS
jgi:hypothetical protein